MLMGQSQFALDLSAFSSLLHYYFITFRCCTLWNHALTMMLTLFTVGAMNIRNVIYRWIFTVVALQCTKS